MNHPRKLIIGLSLAIVTSAMPFAPSVAQTNTVIHLNYGSGSTCDFNTPGISISGSTANSIDTEQGYFDIANSDCPTGGGNTGQADITKLQTTPSSPATVNPGDVVGIKWSAIADICRYDGSFLPGPVSGWQTSGDACIGASNCATGGLISQALTAPGTYTFKLTCTSGAHGSQLQTQAIKQATVQVAGAPPNPTCVAPSGLTQQTTATIADMAGYPVHADVNVENWLDVFGFTWQTIPTEHYGWPGVAASGTKLYINKNQYVALKFTVPSNYTITNPITADPRGTFKTNASAVTNGVNWAVSISPDCGDFVRPAYGQPRNKCYAEYSTSQGATLSWVVTNPGAPMSGFCNLNPGQPYYLNIVAAPLSNPTQSNCTGSFCKVNFQQGGSIGSGPLLP